MLIDEPFKQWGINFIGPMNQMSSLGHIFILTTTNYFPKWVKATITKKENTQVICDFLMNHILVRFKVPANIVTANASYFSSKDIS